MTKMRGSCCAVLLCLAVSGVAVGATGAPDKPADLNVRIVGTASFQGKFTALIEDMNTRSDSFYKVGDPIYGYQITAIDADGVKLQKNGRDAYLAFDTQAVAERTEAEEPREIAMVVPAPDVSEDGMRNFYTEKSSKGTTRWDLFTPKEKKEAKKPALAGAADAARVMASAVTGRFSLPIASFKRVSSGFGYRKHPIGGGSKMHKGVDLAANRGTRILASDSGVVKFSGWKGGYGYCVVVDHQNGYETLYGHCSKLIADVGDNVGKGDLIAEVGSTGASTGNHLHFEVHKNGTAIDPTQFLPNL